MPDGRLRAKSRRLPASKSDDLLAPQPNESVDSQGITLLISSFIVHFPPLKHPFRPATEKVSVSNVSSGLAAA